MTCAIRGCGRGNVVRWGLCVGHAFLYVLGPRMTLADFVTEHEVRHALHKGWT